MPTISAKPIALVNSLKSLEVNLGVWSTTSTLGTTKENGQGAVAVFSVDLDSVVCTLPDRRLTMAKS